MSKSFRCGNCGKKGYPKKSHANAKAEEFSGKYKQPSRVYECLFCPNFLITTQVKREPNE